MSALRVETSEELESLEDFRQRARSFIRANLRQVSPEELRWERNINDDEAELATIKRDRELQRMLFDAGLAGICFPRAYGGQGLSHEHQKVLNEEIRGLRIPPAGADSHSFAVCGRHSRVRHGGAEAAPSPRHLEGRGALDAVPLRAERRLRRGRGAHHGRPRRRAVDPQRLQGMDVWGVVVGLGALSRPDQLGPAEASRSDRVHAAYPPAQCRGPPDRDEQRLAGVLPGVHD